MPMPAQTLTWATVSAAIGIVVAGITIIGFVLGPLNERLEDARQNVIRGIAERDARMDYLQRQIDELEKRLGGSRRRSEE